MLEMAAVFARLERDKGPENTALFSARGHNQII